jgi:hypothetical protein
VCLPCFPFRIILPHLAHACVSASSTQEGIRPVGRLQLYPLCRHGDGAASDGDGRRRVRGTGAQTELCRAQGAWGILFAYFAILLGLVRLLLVLGVSICSVISASLRQVIFLFLFLYLLSPCFRPDDLVCVFGFCWYFVPHLAFHFTPDSVNLFSFLPFLFSLFPFDLSLAKCNARTFSHWRRCHS